jgi:hypothetical protein
MKYDFRGYATKNDLLCSDGRVIRKNAFKDDDGRTVPIVWNHQYNDPSNILGHARLENCEDGVRVYGTFNDSESGKMAKMLVEHGDISALSIYANQLRQKGSDVLHGVIREVSLVLAGANPGAFIDQIIEHGEESEDKAIIYTDEDIFLNHSDSDKSDEKNGVDDNLKENTKEKTNDEETVKNVIDSMTEKQKTVLYALVGQAIEEGEKSDEDEGENKTMKHNIFDNDEMNRQNVISHADQESILTIAKSNSCGSFKAAIEQYADSLQHGFDDIDTLFPDHKDVYPGAPELLTDDQGWVNVVISKARKSPISRIRTRQTDIRKNTVATMRGRGFSKGDQKGVLPNAKLLKRTTDPQTIYVKDALHRDDINDITDFDVVNYQYNIMRTVLNEEVATAAMIGDGRDDGDDNKISEEHIRPIWLDDELYTIHVDVDIEAAREELQGTGTETSFGENYIYAEAIINASLYARERYKGSGKPDFFCTPHLLNVMLLARDMNGRRIYSDVSDLAKALNVDQIHTAEQFEGKTRTTTNNAQKKLLGIFVNMNDYQFGSTKGGEITKFNQFDIDFNQEKYLIETRLSGALTKVYSAIALEEPVVT